MSLGGHEVERARVVVGRLPGIQGGLALGRAHQQAERALLQGGDVLVQPGGARQVERTRGVEGEEVGEVGRPAGGAVLEPLGGSQVPPRADAAGELSVGDVADQPVGEPELCSRRRSRRRKRRIIPRRWSSRSDAVDVGGRGVEGREGARPEPVADTLAWCTSDRSRRRERVETSRDEPLDGVGDVDGVAGPRAAGVPA